MSREILETKNRQGLNLIERALLAALFLAILFSFTGFAVRCEDVSQEVLRLHVLANSDSEEDQELKLQVRDRILQEGAGLLDGVKTLEEAEQVVTEALPRLTQAAQDEIFSRGYDYPVSLTLADVSFTTRQYEEITLPAGVYRALQGTKRLPCRPESIGRYRSESAPVKGITGGVSCFRLCVCQPQRNRPNWKMS